MLGLNARQTPLFPVPNRGGWFKVTNKMEKENRTTLKEKTQYINNTSLEVLDE